MSSRLYRFHCTDGREVIVDRKGKRLPNRAQVWAYAEQVGRILAETNWRCCDWSGWQVDAYNAKGRCVGRFPLKQKKPGPASREGRAEE